jgi:hypothetical protein
VVVVLVVLVLVRAEQGPCQRFHLLRKQEWK